ncbi:MAG TPA: ABC transporter permease subunit [Blastocatellia bacterium]|nr:ABC transporter permease subunit [Blastocatellia bacterium]
MFRILLRREILEGFGSHVFLLALAFLSLLVPLSAYSQARHYQQLVADFNLRRTMHEAENNYQAAVLTQSVSAFLPFYNGNYESLPNEVILRSDSVSQLPASDDLQPINAILPQTDLSLIVGVLLSLMAILLAHDAITGERGRGTLKLIASMPVARRTIVLAKIAGVVLIMAASLIYTVVLYAAIVFWTDKGSLTVSASMIAGVALLLLTAILVLSEIVVLGVAISAMVRHSSMALAISLAVWVGAILLWPNLSPYLASTWQPVSPGEVHRRRVLAIEAEMIRGELAEHQKVAADLSRHHAGIESAWQQYVAIKRAWDERKLEAINEVNAPRDRQLSQQRRLARDLICLSPYGGLTDIFGNLCATGLTDYEWFIASADRYYTEEFLPAVYHSMDKETPWKPGQPAAALFKPKPFDLPAVSMRQRLTYAIWPLSLIVGETILLIAICLVGIRCYDVR